MCGRYSLVPDESKEIAQIVAEVQSRFRAASIHTGEIFLTNAVLILLAMVLDKTDVPPVYAGAAMCGPYNRLL